MARSATGTPYPTIETDSFPFIPAIELRICEFRRDWALSFVRILAGVSFDTNAEDIAMIC
jgi:hypothetical protein